LGVLALLVSACTDESVSYNPFVEIRQDLMSQTNVPVFVAEVEGDVPADQIFWRTVTLDAFDGTQWHVSGQAQFVSPEFGLFGPDTGFFIGPTTPTRVIQEIPTISVIQEITVLALQSDWLPAAYFPIALSAPDLVVDDGYRLKNDDGALRFDGLTYREMTYTVQSLVPRREFGGEFAIEPESEAGELEDVKRFLDLPMGLDPGIRALAVETTQGLDTDFEKALTLESFFRTPGNFVYYTAVVPGHGARDIAAWLLDPSSDNYRTGYCEQFSTSMAVMARTLDIPSRVALGFTPGTLLEDGRVVVRDRNSHAWVELWIPTQGWVRFDPTPLPALFSLPFDIDGGRKRADA
jgi:transglutaminase-like putative cysteine protease